MVMNPLYLYCWLLFVSQNILCWTYFRVAICSAGIFSGSLGRCNWLSAPQTDRIKVINSDHLPPPFRHLSGGNGGTCCADVGQNFGVLAWWTQPPKPQCWEQVPNYVSDISVLTLWFGWLGPSVIVFGFLFWLCPGCGWGDGEGEVQAKTPLLRIIFSIFGLSKQFSF